MPLKLFGPQNIFTAQAVSGTNTYHSSTIDMLCMDTAAMEIQWASGDTAIGTFTVDGSINGTTWYDTGQNVTAPTGAGSPTDNELVNLMGIGFRYLRLTYNNTGGSGTLTVTAVAKGLGA